MSKEVIIDGIKYLPAKEVDSNRDAIIRGLMSEFWGELGESYDEDEKCKGVYIVFTEEPNDYHNRLSVQGMADRITEYAQKKPSSKT